MPSGSSERIVIGADPELKTEVYAALAAQDCTIKDCFLKRARCLCEDHHQLTLSLVAEPSSHYRAPQSSSPTNA